MDKKTQDLAWACLPKEVREEIKRKYKIAENDIDLFIQTLILEDIFGVHNLTSDTEPEEILIVEKSKVQEFYKNLDEHIRINPNDKIPFNGVKAHLKELFGDKCLPDKELNEDNFAKSEPSAQVKPRSKVGDKVRVIGIVGYVGEVTEIVSVDESDPDAPYKLDLIDDEGGGIWCAENAIEPYIEPEKGNKEGKQGNNSEIPNLYQESETKRKETQNLSLSERQNVETKDNMEEKELNLCELLKGCEGDTFFSLMFGDVTFVKVIEEPNLGFGEKPIVTSEGRYLPNAMYGLEGVPTLYPSRALYEKYPLDAYSAWMEWKEARKPKYEFTGCLYIYKEDGATVDEIDLPDMNFNSLEEAQQAAEAVRECLQKFHQRTDM